MDSRLKKYVWAWLPVVLWLAVIGLESTEALSSLNTGSVLYKVLSAIFGPLNHANFDVFHAALRKLGHFVGYATLSLLTFRALLLSASAHPGQQTVSLFRRFAMFAIVFTFLVAAGDEFHQTLLPGRTGAFHDVLLDTAGAVVLQIVLLAYMRQRRAKTPASVAPRN